MKMLLKREVFNPKNTIGKLYIDDKFFCYTLEDIVRDVNQNGKFDNGEKKIYGETAIPYGTYKVIVNISNRFKRLMPLVLDVPEFEGIRMHGGNTEADTLGCILVAHNTDNKRIWGTAEADLTKILSTQKEITLTIVKA